MQKHKRKLKNMTLFFLNYVPQWTSLGMNWVCIKALWKSPRNIVDSDFFSGFESLEDWVCPKRIHFTRLQWSFPRKTTRTTWPEKFQWLGEKFWSKIPVVGSPENFWGLGFEIWDFGVWEKNSKRADMTQLIKSAKLREKV